MAILVSLALPATAVFADTAQDRLAEANQVFSEIMRTPDKGIPQDLLEDAQCVVIIPDMVKAAFVVGGRYGRGFAICRKPGGMGWGAPAAVRMEGGSVGFQIGGSVTDLVLLVMNQHGMDQLMRDKFTIGADATVAAGPVGRMASAGTDVRLDAEILAWSRTKGLFAGIALNGATLRPDKDENAELYGRKMGTRDVVMGNPRMPGAARPLIAELTKYSMRKESEADRRAK
jgi:lipid-binding SYLF domain-containing protein